MTATQAPTPGPLSEESAGPYSCIRCDNSTWNDDDICDQCAAEACAPENAIDWPTAPVEASGSERDTALSILQAAVRSFDNGDTTNLSAVLDDILDALRPQPSGETREAVARVEAMLPAIERIFPVHVTETQDYAELAFHECAAQAMTMEPDTWTALNTLATDLRALLSARPLALGGQQGEERERIARIIDPEAFVPMEDVIGMRKAFVKADAIIGGRHD